MPMPYVYYPHPSRELQDEYIEAELADLRKRQTLCDERADRLTTRCQEKRTLQKALREYLQEQPSHARALHWHGMVSKQIRDLSRQVEALEDEIIACKGEHDQLSREIYWAEESEL